MNGQTMSRRADFLARLGVIGELLLTSRIRPFLVPLLLIIFYISLRMDRLPHVASPPWSGAYIDEVSQVVYGLHILEGITPPVLHLPATLYTFLLGALHLCSFAAKSLMGQYGELQGTQDVIMAATEYFLEFYRDPRGWFIVARCVSLAFGAAALICVYAIARTYVGRTAGLVAAGVYSMLPIDRFLAQVGVTESMSAFFTIAVLGMVLRILTGAGAWAYLVLGLLIGLGLGTKYLVVVTLLPAILAGFLTSHARRNARIKIDSRLPLMLLTLTLATLVANPFLLTQFVIVVKELLSGPLAIEKDYGLISFQTTIRQMIEALGAPSLILASIGAVLCVWQRRWRLCLALCLPFLLVFLLAYGHSLKSHRYLIIMGPSVAVLAGLAVQTFVPSFGKGCGSERKPLSEWIHIGIPWVVTAGIVVFMQTHYLNVQSRFDGSGFSTVGPPEIWIEASVPQHSRIVLWDVYPGVEWNLKSLERIINRLDSRRVSRDAKWEIVFPGTSPPEVAAFDNIFTVDEQLLLRRWRFTAELRRRDGDRGYDVYQVQTRVVSYGMPADTVAEFASANSPTYIVLRESNLKAREELSNLAECYRADGMVVRSSGPCPTQ